MSDKIFDLANLDLSKFADEGYELELLHPANGEKLGIFIKIYGTDSVVYQSALRDFKRRIAAESSKVKKFSLTPEEAEAESLHLLVVVTGGWRGDFELDGAPLEFSPANATKLYSRFPWIRDQVSEAISDRGNFIPRPEKG